MKFVFLALLLLFRCYCIGHTNNWAVLVCTSRFWFNYRHVANALGVYHVLKQNGFRDDHIILMLADDIACDPRNVYAAQVFDDSSHIHNLYRDDTEVDYRGYDVTVENFLRVLLGRHSSSIPKNKRMESDENSNILVYLTGHGGDEFLKFQDNEEVTAEDIAQTVRQMSLKKRFNEMFLIVDTCQASTLFQRIDSNGVVTSASSSLGESSYSYSNDADIGVSIIDRFTFYTLDFFRRRNKEIFEKSGGGLTIKDLFSSYSPIKLNAHPVFRTRYLGRDVSRVPLTDFFSSSVELVFEFEKIKIYNHSFSSQESLFKRTWKSEDLEDQKMIRIFEKYLKESSVVVIVILGVIFTASIFL